MSSAELQGWLRGEKRSLQSSSFTARPNLRTIQLLTKFASPVSRLPIPFQSGKKGGHYGYEGYDGDFDDAVKGYCTGDYPDNPLSSDSVQTLLDNAWDDSDPKKFSSFEVSYDALFIYFTTAAEATSAECRKVCRFFGGRGFQGYTFFKNTGNINERKAQADCACHYDDGHAPDCPRFEDLKDLRKIAGRSFTCTKSEAGAASGPIKGAESSTVPNKVGQFGKFRCIKVKGKSAKSKGEYHPSSRSGRRCLISQGRSSSLESGYGIAGAGGKSGKGKNSLSFVGDGFCRDSEGENYDAVWFFLAGFVETHPEDEEPNLLGLCEAKCKSPPSLNPNIEYVSCYFAVSFPHRIMPA